VPSTWTCPVCERKVPARVAECYCGVRREQVPSVRPGQVPTPAEGSRGWVLLAVALALLLVAVPAARRPWSEDLPPAAASPPASPATPPNTRPRVAETAAPAPPVTVWVPAPVTVPAPSPETPSPSPSATPTMVDDLREKGGEAYRAATTAAIRSAQALRDRIHDYRSHCGGDQPRVDLVIGCDDVRRALERDFAQIRHSLDEADEVARRAWVEPGTQRQIRAEQRVDETIAEIDHLLAKEPLQEP
jgi:hypothetical protein